jgi:glutamyl-tRNA synthetase
VGDYRGRFAPSPTGDLHLGSAAAALFCAAAARRAGGRLVLRMEDIDLGRVIPGKDAAIRDDLRWLGITWDEGPDEGGPVGPYVQSARTRCYEAALERLAAQGLTYRCDCSRAEIARAASAPHAGEEGPRYPGTCRPHGMVPRAFRRPPAVRLAVPEGARVRVDDAVLGAIEEDVAAATGDFVLRRGDGVFAYQLAVVADDVAMGVTEVVRGGDLASSAPRQALLARLLGATPPRFAHVPLLLGPDGARLAKRAPGMTLRDQRTAGRGGADLLRALARAYGHEVGEASDPVEALAAILDWRALRGRTVTVDEALGGRAVSPPQTC